MITPKGRETFRILFNEMMMRKEVLKIYKDSVKKYRKVKKPLKHIIKNSIEIIYNLWYYFSIQVNIYLK